MLARGIQRFRRALLGLLLQKCPMWLLGHRIPRPFGQLNYDSPRALRSPLCKTVWLTLPPFQEFNGIESGNANSPACRHSLELACIGRDR